MSKNVLIIGAGFSGLSAACFMAKAGWQVTVLEKHGTPGGRARQLIADGFRFDMGPSWYWMPDIFEHFFESFGKKVSDYYSLERLDPSYRIYWDDGPMDIPAEYASLRLLFEELEPGAAEKLDRFLDEAAYKYEVGMRKLVYKPGRSLSEFMDWDLAKGMLRLDVFTSIKKHVGRYFRHPRLRQLLEFPVLFLGALPERTPALYSLMNYADIKLGTWFPRGGMYSVVNAMYQLAKELGVRFYFNQNITRIDTEGKSVRKLVNDNGDYFEGEVVIGGADYHFIEQSLLTPPSRSYSEQYWQSRVMAPGCLLYFVGTNCKLKNTLHHSLFFDVPFSEHARDIYIDKKWPGNPLFYVSATSVTDPSLAPDGCENLFFLVPVAAGLKGDDEETREKYFQIILERFEQRTGNDLSGHIVYKKSFALSDFESEYNAFKGNAYGLANTLRQTALLKPSCRSKQVRNLFYTGQLTVPGPGVPPSLVSGEVVSKEVVKYFG